MPEAKYKRVMLKLSGGALSGEHRYGIDTPTLIGISRQIKLVIEMGVGVAIVVGGMILPRRHKNHEEKGFASAISTMRRSFIIRVLFITFTWPWKSSSVANWR